jgi:hypothetical protein
LIEAVVAAHDPVELKDHRLTHHQRLARLDEAPCWLVFALRLGVSLVIGSDLILPEAVAGQMAGFRSCGATKLGGRRRSRDRGRSKNATISFLIFCLIKGLINTPIRRARL